MTARPEAGVAGVDGCHGGWLAVWRLRAGGALQLHVSASVTDLVEQLASCAVLALDVLMGLPNAGSRACDRAARSFLGRPRASSVFPAPVRPVLAATTYADACEVGQRVDGRRLTRQTWAILPKIREVDALLRREPDRQSWVREVHPEVSFAAWRGRPMAHAKRTPEGRAERRALIEGTYGPVASLVQALPRGQARTDDLFDACAALWTAERIAAGRAATLPDGPPADACGLRMEIVY
jgi:predicted RNase H-like nuclease